MDESEIRTYNGDSSQDLMSGIVVHVLPLAFCIDTLLLAVLPALEMVPTVLISLGFYRLHSHMRIYPSNIIAFS